MEKNKSIFDTLKEFQNIGTKKESIYKPEILQGTEKERKAIRRKIRNSRDNMIELFNSSKKSEKKHIAEKWLEFAKNVYVDTNIIFEANTTDDKASLISEFVADIKKELV